MVQDREQDEGSWSNVIRRDLGEIIPLNKLLGEGKSSPSGKLCFQLHFCQSPIHPVPSWLLCHLPAWFLCTMKGQISNQLLFLTEETDGGTVHALSSESY